MEISNKSFSGNDRLAATILETIGAVVCIMNIKGRIVLFNKASQELTGYSQNEVLNQYPWDLFILPEEVDGVKSVFRNLTLGNFPNQYTNYWLTRSGEKRLISWSNTALADENNQLVYIIATGIDITEQKKAEDKIIQSNKELERLVEERTSELNYANQKLEMMAYHDSVTGLYNRRYLDESLDLEIRRSHRNRQPLSFLLIDVDYFKNYNDFYGHLAGDDCLKKIAVFLKIHFQRASDLIARYGGEEFCVILPNISCEEAKVLCDTLMDTVWNVNIPHHASAIADRVTISIGLTSCNADSQYTRDALIKSADKALYAAKGAGRNRIEISHDYDG